MCVQLEFCSGKATKILEIHQIHDRLAKVQKIQGGLFARLNELKQEAEFLAEQLEQIHHEAIYGPSEAAQ